MSGQASLLVLLFALLPAWPALAAEICVSCSGPTAIYRCSADPSSGLDGHRYGDRILRFACIAELSKLGNHEKCRARKGASEPCIGAEHIVTLSGSIDAMASKATAAEPRDAENIAPDAAAAAEAKGDAGPPKTMEELARRTAAASKEQLGKTGDTLGGAMKKSWNCFASLFKDC